MITSQNNILLTISILISNRPDTVEKCLKSLHSLRTKIPSELILVDTGCGEQVRKLVEPYADEIVEFPWCNDFSKARNAGLKRAKGEWFLYLDDDEWFQDTKEIEDFFLSDKHLRYHYASYLVRNYFDLEGKKYRDEYVGRMVRLEPDTHFIHAIHEVFSKARDPWIRLHSYVHHYGYAFRNEEEARRHGQRNIALLQAEHEKEPGDLRHNAHLVKEYNALKEWEESIRISKEGIQHASPGRTTEQFLGGLYVNIVRNYVMLEQYANAAEIGEEYLRLEHTNELDRAAICYNLCIAYLEMQGYTKSIEMAGKYLDFYEKWKIDRDATAFYEYLAVAYMSDGCKQAALCIAVQDGMKLGQMALAKKYFGEIDWNMIPNMLETQGVRGMVQALVWAWLHTDPGVTQECAAMMDVILQDRALKEMLAAEIYMNLQKEPASVLIRAKELDLWEMACRDHVNIGQVILGIPLYLWEKAAEKVVEKLDWRDTEELHGHLKEELNADSVYLLYWNIPYRMRKLQVMISEESREGETDGGNAYLENIVRELLVYATENERVCRRLYREELFQRIPKVLPLECQVSLKLTDMAEAVERDDFQRALSSVREALEIMPELSGVLKCCIKWISVKADDRSREQEMARDEIRKLSQTVRMTVRSLAEQGMVTEALGTLQQLKALAPGDLETEKLEQEIMQMGI